MSPQQGWYDDPGGSGQLRWWDGRSWTTSTATSRAAPRPTSGEDAVGPQPVDMPGWSPPRLRMRKVLLAPLVAGILVAAAGAVAFLLVGQDGDAQGFGSAVATPAALSAREPLRVGDVVAGIVPRNGIWHATIETTGGRAVIDVRGLASTDPVATLYEQGGRLVEENDDRSRGDRNAWGGRRLDSLIDTQLAAGSYVLQVREYDGDPGEIQVKLQVLDGRTADQ